MTRTILAAAAVGVILLLVALARRDGNLLVRGDATHVDMAPDTQWVLVVKRLVAAEITDPALLVFIVNNCDIELASGRFDMVRGFPRSLATVAAALGTDVPNVERAFIHRTARRSDAAALIEKAKDALPRIRAALPDARVGERVVGMFGADPERLVYFTRYAAQQDGVPLPPPRSSPEWKRLIAAMPRTEANDAAVLLVLTQFRRVSLASGSKAEPLEEDDAYVTVAEALGTTADALRNECSRRFAAAHLVTGPNFAKSAVELEHVLARLPGVVAVDRSPETFPQTVVAKRTIDGSSPRAPWEEFPEDPTSARWRMGPGEDLMDSWHEYWRSLAEDERGAYLAEHSAPREWREWLASIR